MSAPMQETPQSLNTALTQLREAAFAQMPEALREGMGRAMASLAASGIAARALRAGDAAPDFALPDTEGRTVRLAELRARGPVVLVFYRGGWCPFCSVQMAHLARARAEIEQLGAAIVAVSPQTLDASKDSEGKFHPGFPLLSDAGDQVAEAYGLRFNLEPEMIEIYRGFGVDLPAANGEDRWSLPIPATYVIGRDGVVLAAHVDSDHTTRMEPSEVLAALRR